MFRKLLVPLDRSSLAEQAIGQAVAIAQASHAAVELVLVHEPLPVNGFSDAPWNAEQWEEEQKYLESIAAELISGSEVAVSHAIVRGAPVDAICRHARDVHADLVVMTSHGRTGLSRTWLGSVAHGVLRHARVPVLMLRPTESKAQQVAAHHLFNRILVPVDGSTRSVEVLGAAAALARCSQARVSLLRVVQPVPLISLDAGIPYAGYGTIIDDPATTRLAEDTREQLADTARQLREQMGVDAEMHVLVDDHVASTIIDFARAHDIDAIAMSTHGRGLSRFVFGSVADKVLRGSGVPVLMYRPAEARTTGETTVTSTEAEAPALSHA